MKISEMIKLLMDIQIEFGDLPVQISVGSLEYDPEFVDVDEDLVEVLNSIETDFHDTLFIG